MIGLCGATLLAAGALYADVRRREIPDWVPLGMLSLWIATAALAPEALNGTIRAALICGAGAFAGGYVFYRLGWLGGGDGKLLGALALWLGPWEAGIWLLATATLGLALCLIALARPTGDFRTRGIPFVWAIAPPAIMLLVARATELTGA
ncbi:MAG: prepilin peptidase [Gammaproteobacteria bacterium]|nr:prepilin peptidase [Gammaproteobacteria bacterium]